MNSPRWTWTIWTGSEFDQRKRAAPFPPNIVHSGPPPFSPEYNVEGPARPPSPAGGGIWQSPGARGGGRAPTVPAWRRPPINYVSARRSHRKNLWLHGQNPRLGGPMNSRRHSIRNAELLSPKGEHELFSPLGQPQGCRFLKARGFRVAALRLIDRELGKKSLPHPEKSRRNDRRAYVFAEK